jgi:hypothetical protein
MSDKNNSGAKLATAVINTSPLGCLRRQVMILLITSAVAFGACAACALFSPIAFQSLINVARGAGLKTYTLVLQVTGNPALKLTTWESDVTAIGRVQRDMGLLSLAYGQGAEVMGTVRIALGADLKNNQFGILSCDIDTNTVRTSSGSAPLAGTAFDLEQIEQEAYRLFKLQAAEQSLKAYWPETRRRLKDQFASWALGLDIPEQPTLTECPTISAPGS